MILNQSFLNKRPKSFNPVDVDLSLPELISNVDVEMLITREHEGIVSSPPVCVTMEPLLTLYNISVMRLSAERS